MGFLGMPRSEVAAHATEARAGVQAPLALLAASCILLGILPTFVIPAIDRAVVPITHMSAWAALVPPFFNVDSQRQENLPVKFVAEFHDLGVQVGGRVLPGRGLVVLHRGEEQNPVVFAMSTSYTVVAFATILAVAFIAFIAFQLLSRRQLLRRGPAWAGGLRHLWPEITYTAMGFSNPCASSSRPSSSLRRARTASKPSQSIFGRQSSGTARRFTSSTGWRSTP
jgi:hypothetical protein